MSDRGEATGLSVQGAKMLVPLLSSLVPVLAFTPQLFPLAITVWALVLGASFVIGAQQIRQLDASIDMPGSAYAWESIPATVTLHNRGLFGSTHDLLIGHALSGDRMKHRLGYQARVRPRETVRLTAPLRVPRRGRHRRYRLEITSGFPFGLLEWRRSLEFPCDLLALPRLGEIRETDRVLPELLIEWRRRPRGTWRPGEFYALQEWRPGVPQRQVAWKASARRGELLVRQNQLSERPAAHIILHVGRAADTKRAAFERAVSLTATLAETLLRRHQSVQLTLFGRQTLTWRPRPGRSGLFDVLTHLAEIEAEKNAPRELPAHLLQRGSAVIIHAGGLDAAPSSPRVRVFDARNAIQLRRFFREARAMPAHSSFARSI